MSKDIKVIDCNGFIYFVDIDNIKDITFYQRNKNSKSVTTVHFKNEFKGLLDIKTDESPISLKNKINSIRQS